MTDRVTTGQADACADQWQKRYEIACAATKQAIARAEKAEAELAKSRSMLAEMTVDHTEALQVLKAVANATPSWDANPNDKVMISVPVWATAQACTLTDDHAPFTQEQIDTYTELALSHGQPNPLLKRLKAERDRLAAIVERLPKTKDGVYVIPGQDVWVWWTNGQCYRVDFADNTIPVWIGDSVDGGRDVRVDECYSTREAAEAAAKGVGDG